MLRTALRPRWLLLLVVVVVATAGMARLGQWQLDRARESSRSAERERLSAAPVDISTVIRPQQAIPNDGIERPVTATGRWDGARRVLLPGRSLEGRTGLWVLTPLVLADGSAVPVMRGWVPSAEDPAASAAETSETVTVTGVLLPPEPRLDTAPGTDLGLPADQIPRIDVVELVKRWPHPLVDAYVHLRTASPDAAPAPTPVPLEARSDGVSWRNFSYALQWWIFAAFGLFLWWRIVRDDHLRRRGDQGPDDRPSGDPDRPRDPDRPGDPDLPDDPHPERDPSPGTDQGAAL